MPTTFHANVIFDYNYSKISIKHNKIFMILNFRRVLHVVCFHLGNSPASEFYMPTFRNTLSVPFSYAMTKFENRWGIHMREGMAENSLSQLEGG
jgi:hypothetical protein